MADRRFTFRDEAVAVAVALLVLLGAELATRVVGADSADSRDLAAVPGEIDRVGREDRLVVMLGNSTTREGYDATVMEERLADDEHPVSIVTIAPDDTTVADWTAAYTHVVGARRPDLVVVSFVSGQVADGLPRHLSRLATDFSDWGDLPGRLADAESVDDALELASARASVLYAHRVEVADRLLGLLPEYRRLARADNAVARGSARLRGDVPCCGYDDLRELLGLIGPSRAVVVALPDRPDTPLDATLSTAVTEAGATFIDARHVPGIGPEQFADDIHLDEDGRRLMTTWLSPRLARVSP